ncbi:MAG TPA: PEP-CTERM sorting domain-containing protein [Opitutaceae bacterium]|nr:PEP-CTERM sorting domain-containing protein [Opitutaceae bacterium]
MKSLLLPCSLLVASTVSYGALSTPSHGGPRLTDYQAWFDGFDVASDGTVYSQPYPDGGTPAPFSDANRTWSGWTPNWGSDQLAPIANTDASRTLFVETLFVGETAAWWNDWGYRITASDGTFTEVLLADGIQAAGPMATVSFGDYTYVSLAPGESLDFFYNGTNGYTAGDGDNFDSVKGGRYYAFDSSLTQPGSATMQSYYGTLTPLTSVRGPAFMDTPFTILGFEDINDGANWQDRDHNDLLFAFRSGFDLPQGPIPEPSTYGLTGAAALLAVVGYRRLRRKN